MYCGLHYLKIYMPKHFYIKDILRFYTAFYHIQLAKLWVNVGFYYCLLSQVNRMFRVDDFLQCLSLKGNVISFTHNGDAVDWISTCSSLRSNSSNFSCYKPTHIHTSFLCETRMILWGDYFIDKTWGSQVLGNLICYDSSLSQGTN